MQSTTLTLNIGHTTHEQVTNLQAIKDAMASAMIQRWETGTASPNDNTFAMASLIYMEAHTLLQFINL